MFLNDLYLRYVSYIFNIYFQLDAELSVLTCNVSLLCIGYIKAFIPKLLSFHIFHADKKL